MQRFIVFSAGYNCRRYIQKNMLSLRRQAHDNYVHVIVDDASTDGTYDEILKFKDEKTFVYRNGRNLKWLHNAVKYMSLHVESPNDIIAILDLDDWLPEGVLGMLDRVYDSEDCWATYGTLQRYPSGDVRKSYREGYPQKVVMKRTFRKHPWRFHSLRTFKVFIWNAIDKKSFQDGQGRYFPTSYDHVIGFPILELTPPEKLRYIQRVTYTYNEENPIRDKVIHEEDMVRYSNWIRRKGKRHSIIKKGQLSMQKFIIFSAGYNCAKYVKRNLRWIQKQTYKNYIHIVVDDASTDKTYDKIMKYKDERTIVYRNERNQKWLANAVQYLTPHIESRKEVIVMVDLDDWLINEHVLDVLNNTYNKRGCWVTYGSCRVWIDPDMPPPPGAMKNGRILPDGPATKEVLRTRNFRKAKWDFTHLQTFKAFLWNAINKEDFKNNKGGYIPYSMDRAFMYPVLEMTPSNKIFFIREALYSYNNSNPLCVAHQDRKTQMWCEKFFRNKPGYRMIER